MTGQRDGRHAGRAQGWSAFPPHARTTGTDIVIVGLLRAPHPTPDKLGYPRGHALLGQAQLAAEGGRWALVGQLAGELEARRVARMADSRALGAARVTPLDAARRQGHR